MAIKLFSEAGQNIKRRSLNISRQEHTKVIKIGCGFNIFTKRQPWHDIKS